MTLDKATLFRFAPLLLATLVPQACATSETIDNAVLEAVEAELAASSSDTTDPTATSSTSTNTAFPTATATDPGPTSSATAAPTDTGSSPPSASSLPPPSSTPSATDTGVTPSETVTAAPLPTPTDTATGTASGTPTPSGTATSSATAPAGSGGAPAVPSDSGGAPSLGDGGVSVACEMPATDVPQALLDATDVEVLYVTYDQNAMGSVQFQVRIRNLATMNLPLKDITVRYWFTIEAGVTYMMVNDQIGEAVTGAKSAVKETTDGRTYVEITYPDKDLMLSGGSSDPTVVAVRLQSSGNMQFDNSDDWSWAPSTGGNATPKVNDKITVYRRGALVSGEEQPCE